jgi:hypothetical protein
LGDLITRLVHHFLHKWQVIELIYKFPWYIRNWAKRLIQDVIFGKTVIHISSKCWKKIKIKITRNDMIWRSLMAPNSKN